MSLIEKIDAMDIAPFLAVDMNIGYQAAIRDIKQIILSEQKEPCKGCKHYGNYENEVEYGYPSPCTKCKRRCVDNYQPDATDINVTTKSGKDNNALTIGDKIRKNNGKTANLLHELADCKKCPVIDGCTANNDYACYGRLFDFLNQVEK